MSKRSARSCVSQSASAGRSRPRARARGSTRADARAPANIVLKTTRMSRLVEHEPADLVATAEAGLTLADFNREVGRAGQWLPLDPPGARRGDARRRRGDGRGRARRRFGYGAPRSHVLGMRVALAGGRVIRAGGRVVKNVAGYDLCKLFTGSHGTLGVILEVTFRLRPRPRREATLVTRSAELRPLLEAASRARAARNSSPSRSSCSRRALAEEVRGVVRRALLSCSRASRGPRARSSISSRARRSWSKALRRRARPSPSKMTTASGRDSHRRVRGQTARARLARVRPPVRARLFAGAARRRRRARIALARGRGRRRLRVFDDDAGSSDERLSTRAAAGCARRRAPRAAHSSSSARPNDSSANFDAWGLTDSAAFL